MKFSIALTSLVALTTSVAAGLISPTATPTCTTTINKPVTFDLNPTTTIYKTTVTATSKVNCSGCELVFTSLRQGPGPVRVITATVTKHATTTTETVCASPRHY